MGTKGALNHSLFISLETIDFWASSIEQNLSENGLENVGLSHTKGCFRCRTRGELLYVMMGMDADVRAISSKVPEEVQYPIGAGR